MKGQGASFVITTGLLCCHCSLKKMSYATKGGTSSCSGHVEPIMALWPRLVRSGTSPESVLECQVRFRSSEQREELCKDGGRKESLLLCSLDTKHQRRAALPTSGFWKQYWVHFNLKSKLNAKTYTNAHTRYIRLPKSWHDKRI